MALIPDLVQDSKLDTEFHSDPEYTQHVQYVSGSTPKQRRLRKEYIWKREKGLGRGGFGIIWLERCIQGDSKGEVRVVKKIQKLESSNYYRELEAIALFSQAKVIPPLIFRFSAIFPITYANLYLVRPLFCQVLRLVR